MQRIRGSAKLKSPQPECTREVKQISEKIDLVLNNLLNATTYQQAVTARYEVELSRK